VLRRNFEEPISGRADHDPNAGDPATAEGGRSLLELTTQFVSKDPIWNPIEGEWRLKLYKGASEAGGSFQQAPRRNRSSNRGIRGEAENPARSAEMASRRAASRLRRYVVANRLNRLGTLTYAVSCEDQRQVRKDVGEFFRSLHAETEKPFPYLWVPEWHPKGHGLHLHFAVGKYIPRSKIVAAWGRGWVHIKLLDQVPIGQGSLGEARRAAIYLGKYLRKGFEEKREFNLRRFDAARGYAPKSELIVARSAEEVKAEACRRMGGLPSYEWRSRDQEGWIGPNAMWLTWDQ
jgi:hypothetical protein